MVELQVPARATSRVLEALHGSEMVLTAVASRRLQPWVEAVRQIACR